MCCDDDDDDHHAALPLASSPHHTHSQSELSLSRHRRNVLRGARMHVPMLTSPFGICASRLPLFASRSLKNAAKLLPQHRLRLTMSATTLVIGTYTEPMGHVPSAHAAGAYVVTHDASTGTWGQLNCADLGCSPSYLATLHAPSGSCTAVAANESSHTLTSSQLLPSPATPPVSVFLGDRPACCSYPCHVAAHPSQNWVISCSYFGGVASVHPVAHDENGILVVGDSCCTLRVTSSSGCDPDRQAAPHLHCARFAPCGTAALLCDLGADCVYVCSFSPSSGQLQLSSSCAMGAGTEPRLPPPQPPPQNNQHALNRRVPGTQSGIPTAPTPSLSQTNSITAFPCANGTLRHCCSPCSPRCRCCHCHANSR